LEAALVNEALGAVRTVEQPPLERSRTEVGDKNLHGCGARSAGSRSRSAVHSACRTHSSHLPSAARPSCGRGMTCTLTTVPTCEAAAAPASVAAFTLATSPRKNAVT